MELKSQSETLLESLKPFYEDEKNAQYLQDVLEKKKNISLRKLEWFITDYSKKKNLTVKSKKGKPFLVHVEYKSSLDGYSKKLFDPFCRTERIEYTIPGTEKVISTTVAQLNFIKWCIKNNIIDYIQESGCTKQHRD